MPFASIRIITEDVARLADFYELVTGATAVRAGEVFAQLSGPGATLAIGSSRTVAAVPGAAEAGANRSVIVEFRVDDVDAEFERLRDAAPAVVLPPTDMPWGNRSALLRDPDGNLVNLFAPIPGAAPAAG
ncbi:VOC family protein [Pseudolysinimonas kribbensis]|uniref:Glyoxalase n=1 Tax=Pseudolysinimonas kribbensis TaxID=433641 RepID=A0ABQ6K6P3_9MICO|nr:VOC family protein [Pseudolysinimonas kribbensis]GMA96312.1 glyoxalase [Pseudolysinimonas kribbensis]